MKKGENFLLAAAIASILLPASQSAAQDVLEEIIVTAERRATTEQVTAISMNVLTAEDLATNRTQNIADLQQTTPNVTINSPGGFNSINIRGIGNSAITPAITTGVAVFQDGLVSTETLVLGNQFLDLGTIEVLRGPQGTFVGASSTGGAIRLNSVRPSLDGGMSGFVEGLVGDRSNVKVTGAVNLPFSETFAARLAFNQERRSNYFYSKGAVILAAPNNPFREQGRTDDMNARVSLLWKPTDALELIWRSETNRTDNGGTPVQPNPRTFLNVNGQPTHSRYWNYDAPADPNHDPAVLSINTLDTQFITMVDRHSLEWTYTFANDVAFRSLTGLVHNEVRYVEDSDGSFATARTSRSNVGPDNNYYSQEFNLISPEGPFNWIVGASWFYRKTPANGIDELYNCGISPVDGTSTPCRGQFNIPVPSQFNVINSETTIRSGGVFAQVNWQFVESLELTLGARYNVDRNFAHGRVRSSGTTQVQVGVAPSATNVPCPPEVQGIIRYAEINWDNTRCVFQGARGEFQDETPTWKVGLNWTPGDNNFVYLFWTRGYKSGGIDSNRNLFGPEELNDYELGWKGTFANGRAQLNLGAFYMDYKDMQQQAFRAVAGATVANNNAPFNIGDATIQGIEAEFNGKFGGLGIQANVGWVDSELGDISLIDRSTARDSDVRAPGSNADLRQCNPGEAAALVLGGCVDWTPYYRSLSGERNVFSPELQYAITLLYDIAAGKGTWTPRATFSHTGASDVNLIRREEFWTIEERNLLSLSLTYEQDDWLAQAYCANCADETYIAAIATGGPHDAYQSVVYGNPRTYGIRFRKSF